MTNKLFALLWLAIGLAVQFGPEVGTQAGTNMTDGERFVAMLVCFVLSYVCRIWELVKEGGC